MKVEGYLVPKDDFIKKGQYKDTELDRLKKEADMLITGFYGNWFMIWLNKPIEVKTDRNVQRDGDRGLFVNEKGLNRLKKGI